MKSGNVIDIYYFKTSILRIYKLYDKLETVFAMLNII